MARLEKLIVFFLFDQLFLKTSLMICLIFRLETANRRQTLKSAPVARPTSVLGFRGARTKTSNPTITTSSTNLNCFQPEASLLDENGLPLIGHLLAFTPDVIQTFQDAARCIEESREIKKQAMNQIKDAFNDAKAYSLTVNQSVAQKLADIITLAVSKIQIKCVNSLNSRQNLKCLLV